MTHIKNPLTVGRALRQIIPGMGEQGCETTFWCAFRFRLRYFTPCIRRWINGAIRNSTTPEPTRAQNPKV